MRLVHDQDEVWQRREVVKVALADVLRQALNSRGLAAAHLRVDLRDIEDVHLAGRGLLEQWPTHRLVVVASDDGRRCHCKLGDAPEHVLRGVRCEVGDQLVVDGEVRREYEEIAYSVGAVQIGDERTHEASLADARRECETERWKFALEIRNRRELRLNGRKCSCEVQRWTWLGDLPEPVEDLKGATLRRSQAEPARDGRHLAMNPVGGLLVVCCHGLRASRYPGFLGQSPKRVDKGSMRN